MCGLVVCGDLKRLDASTGSTARRRRCSRPDAAPREWPRAGTRSCSSSSVAWTRGSAWKRVTKTSSQQRRWRARPATCPGGGRRRRARLGRGQSPLAARRRRGVARPCSRSLRRSRTGRRARAREPLEVRRRGGGIDEAGQRGGVRRDDEIVGEPALQPQARDAERLVLIVARAIGEGVGRLRDAPRHAALAAVFDLPPDARRGSSGRAACRDSSASAAAASGTRTSCRPTTSASRGRRRW